MRVLGLACLAFIVYAQWKQLAPPKPAVSSSPEANAHGLSIEQLQQELATCAKLHHKPVDPVGFGRTRNARYVDGKKSTIIRNATVWVGEPLAHEEEEDGSTTRTTATYLTWISADVFIEHGLIKKVAKNIALSSLHLPSDADVVIYDAKGRPLTSGLIDMHSHAAVHSLPTLHGNEDVSELSRDSITPYVRTLDGIQPTDQQLQVIKSGGVTASLILPGSSNNIGGEAFVVKHAVGRADGRRETSVSDMLADPDRTWRHMKMACGENAKQVHGKAGERGPYSRLGESWEFRRAFEYAARLKREQDDWCTTASAAAGAAGGAAGAGGAGGWDHVKSYLPFELQWEALVALLRGQVHVHAHCYTITDLEAFVDHTNEFKFPVRAFHHAHQAYLVPEILKRAWGRDPPAAALFADNMWYKAEAAVGSEYAGKRLHDAGLVPIYVSDNPVLNAQHLVLEAAKAYRYGLPYHAALASVTSAPAERLGLGQRLGKIKPGFDADVVVWDSDPLRVGATPVQVWIDGTAQYEDPIELKKPFERTILSKDDDDDDDGTIPEQQLKEVTDPGDVNVVFTGISKVLLPSTQSKADDEEDDGLLAADGKTYNVAVSNGQITCIGRCEAELEMASSRAEQEQEQGGGDTRTVTVVSVKNGCLSPAFTAFGSTLGLNSIETEQATDNGDDGGRFSRGVDGLALDTEKLRVAHRYGVTRAISAPKFAGAGTHHGTSAGFLTGAQNVLDHGAVFVRDAALHYTLDLSAKRGVVSTSTTTISAAVGELRYKLLRAVASLQAARADDEPARVGVEKEDEGRYLYSEAAFLRKVVRGQMPLAITVHSADTIAALVDVKVSVEQALMAVESRPFHHQQGKHRAPARLRMIVVGGAEAHLVAGNLSSAGIGVVLAPAQSFGVSWDQRRALTGAPLTHGTAIDALIDAGVVTAIGLEEDWLVRDVSLLAGVAWRNGEGRLSETEAVDLVSRNIDRLLGLSVPSNRDFVIFQGSPLEIGSRVIAVGGDGGRLYLAAKPAPSTYVLRKT